jgi:hypothetical protein
MSEKKGGEGYDWVQQWDYDTHFREYALLFGNIGPNALESIKKYPDTIKLNREWHEGLNRIRKETARDWRERYVLVTCNSQTGEVNLPEVSTQGNHTHIPVNVLTDVYQKTDENPAVTSVIGDIHSHPIRVPFSPEDLLPLLDKSAQPALLFVGLTTSRENIFAFKTKETEPIENLNTMPEKFYEFFRAYWLKQAGYKALGSLPVALPINMFPNIWRVSFGIAEKHRLALYKGKPGADLTRIQTNKSLSMYWSNLLNHFLKP